MRLFYRLALASGWFLLVVLVRPTLAQPPDPLSQYPVPAAQLPAHPDGPGVGVCEPIARNAPPPTAAFGAGCARWLQFALGASTELGQTPRWDAQGRVQKELGLSDLRLTAAQAARFAGRVGYTHVAVGEITGNPARCTLTYQVYALPSQKGVGTTLKATGTEAQVIAALPGLARQILRQLKVTPPPALESAALTPAEMRQIGQYPWMRGTAVSEAEKKAFDALTEHQPLASLLALMHQTPSRRTSVEEVGRRLLSQAPNNLLVRAELAVHWNNLSPALREELGRNLPDRRNHYVIALCALVRARTLQEQITRCEHLVGCAPRNPTSWLQLADMYSGVSEQVRRGKLAALVTQAEWSLLTRYYAREVATAKRATELDPDYGRAWTVLAASATFAGDATLADNAIWKALRLDKGNVGAHFWGLQMFQPKWLDDAAKLARVARLAAADTTLSPDDAFTVSAALHEARFPAEGKSVLARALQGYRDAVRKRPNDAEAHRILGYRLYQLQQYEEAATELQTALRLEPESAPAHYDLGLVYAATRRAEAAVTEFREGLKRSPGAYLTRTELGQALTSLKRYEEAEQEYRKVLGSHPDVYRAATGLGDALLFQKKYAESIKWYEAASYLSPQAGGPYIQLCWLYDQLRQYDKAIEYGERGVRYLPDNYEGRLYLGTAYFDKEQYPQSVEQFQKAVDLSPKETYARLLLANALLKAGKKEEARAALKELLRLEPMGEYAKVAQQLLTQNP